MMSLIMGKIYIHNSILNINATEFSFFAIVLVSCFIFIVSIFILYRQSNYIYSNTIIIATLLIVSFFSALITLLWSQDFNHGVDTLGNLFLFSIFSILIFIFLIQNRGLEKLLESLLFWLSILLILTVVYKLNFGFFDRDVRFFMNGPIVFGRIMGIGFIISLFFKNDRIRRLLSVSFFIAILWTGSKGPLISAVLVYIIYLYHYHNFAKFSFYIFISSLVVFFLVSSFQFGIVERIAYAFLEYTSGDFSFGESSIGGRITIWEETYQIIMDHYVFGIGIGSWEEFTGHHWAEYPHNFFLEAFSELGVFLGILFIAPFCIFLSKKINALHLTALFLLINQQFSGDLLDARYLLVFSVLTFLYRNKPNKLMKVN
jgi:O-antigen ligase